MFPEKLRNGKIQVTNPQTFYLVFAGGMMIGIEYHAELLAWQPGVDDLAVAKF